MRQQQISSILHEGGMDTLGEIVAAVRRDPSLVEAVVAGLNSDDPFIRWRSAYAMEKISKKHPTYLHSYKNLLIEYAMNDQPDVRVSLIQLLPRLPLDEQERAVLFGELHTLLSDASEMLKIVSLQTLVALMENDAALRPQMLTLLEEQKASGIPANQSLAKYQLTRLTISGAALEGQPRKRTSFRERWRQNAPIYAFSSQYIKTTMHHYEGLKKQIQERERQALPTKNAILKQISNLFYGIFGLVCCVILAYQVLDGSLYSASSADYFIAAGLLGIGLIGLGLFYAGIKNLMRMRRRLSQTKLRNETEGEK